MIEDFSGGYYRTQMDVQEYDDGPVIEKSLYDFINKELYVDSSRDVTVRIGMNADSLFEVEAESAIPRDVLAVPQDITDSYGMQNIFILKSEYADTVGEYYG